jgi:hypothetical protein
MVSDKKIFMGIIHIGSYVKLSSVVAAILVGDLKCRTQFNQDGRQAKNRKRGDEI